MFKAGEKIIRQKDKQMGYQKTNWEAFAKTIGFDPYSPVEVLGSRVGGKSVFIKEIGWHTSFNAELFQPVSFDSNLEDWL